MSSPIPSITANVDAPVRDSCNCCDNISFSCCLRKPKTPKHTCGDRKVQEASQSIKPQEKKDQK